MADALTSSDLRKQAAVPTMVRNGQPASNRDEIDDAYNINRKVIAANMVRQTAVSTETESIKAEVERLKAQQEKQALTAALQPPPAPQQPALADYLMAQIGRAQEQMAESQREAHAAQKALLEERMNWMQGELEKSKAEGRKVETPIDPVQSALTTLEAAQALVAKTTPPVTGGTAPVIDADFEMRRLTLIGMQEERRITAENDRKRLEAQLQLEQWKAEREEARLDKSAQTQDRFLTDTVPQIVKIAQDFYVTWQQRLTVTAQTVAQAAPTAMPQAAPMTTPNPPAYVLSDTCGQCGNRLYYTASMGEIVCPQCYAVNTIANPSSDPSPTQEVAGAGSPSNGMEGA